MKPDLYAAILRVCGASLAHAAAVDSERRDVIGRSRAIQAARAESLEAARALRVLLRTAQTGIPKCKPGKPCAWLRRALDETSKFGTKRRSAGLEFFVAVVASGTEQGYAYRTGAQKGASLIVINCCPWCGGNPSEISPPKPKGAKR